MACSFFHGPGPSTARPGRAPVGEFPGTPARPALATVKEGLAFLQRADPQEGMYPEGAPEAGLSVEVYHHDQKGNGQYVELEQLSPLRRLDQGITLTTRWSIHPVPELPLAEELQWMRHLLRQ